MSTAAEVAKKNEEQGETKEALAKEYAETVLSIRQLEKKKDYLKAKLAPQMVVGERIGLVEKVSKEKLDISDELLVALEKKLGEVVIRKEVNTPLLREMMKADEKIDKMIPRVTTTELKVG